METEVKPIGIQNNYCRIVASPKQYKFWELDDLEVFFGGACGGGKSTALLMSALKYCQVPGYSALILRKDFARLELPGGLIPRSHEWFRDTKAKWNASRRQWIIPNQNDPDAWPASISFGYLKGPLDKFRYASSEYQYIAFDELTDFSEEDYLFLFSRLRRNTSYPVPLRMRSASNPGGPGHSWVRERFIGGVRVGGQAIGDREQRTGDSGDHNSVPCFLSPVSFEPSADMFQKQGRFYIPSRMVDNPGLDAKEYRRSLMHLPVVVREQLMNGDWDVQEQALVKQEWLRYYVEDNGQMELLEPSGRILATIGEGVCRRFATVDPAGTSAERSREAKGWTPSWTVVQVWDRPPRELSHLMLLRYQIRERVDLPTLCGLIKGVHRDWRPERIWIEGEKLGRAVYDLLHGKVPIELLKTGRSDKSVRAGPLLVKLERGEVFLPKYNTTWRPLFELELLTWKGEEQQAADQVDAAAYAAIVVGEGQMEAIRIGCR
jgi:phage terminase large subunit-like protein